MKITDRKMLTTLVEDYSHLIEDAKIYLIPLSDINDPDTLKSIICWQNKMLEDRKGTHCSITNTCAMYTKVPREGRKW